MKPGIFLKSTSPLDDTIFEKSVIFVAEYNEKGAMGFIINKEFPRKLNELEEFKNIISFPIHLGGPVDQEHLYFVHQRPDLIEGGIPVTDNIFLGGDFKSAVKNIDNNILSEKDIKIFIGYCGWDYLELDEEITEGSWMILDARTLF
ncbi:putative transcriptional regulator [Chitinophaga sp. YR573]|uniref:YqgE/AlgH family protein n=1 Tax=Chitinophaga sp. YR573 TaxID=1881040 RepID=UPI0008D4985D|nr:YqgE/AlgH family protein [Chitinophaga sp. YR573]SEW18918.1 putative transcriptional regulator [Chitinophaga sp. YR573]